VWHFRGEQPSWRRRIWSRVRAVAALVWFAVVGLFIAALIWSVVSTLGGGGNPEQDQPDHGAECPNLIITGGAEC
jgi:hypothetical protein